MSLERNPSLRYAKTMCTIISFHAGLPGISLLKSLPDIGGRHEWVQFCRAYYQLRTDIPFLWVSAGGWKCWSLGFQTISQTLQTNHPASRHVQCFPSQLHTWGNSNPPNGVAWSFIFVPCWALLYYRETSTIKQEINQRDSFVMEASGFGLSRSGRFAVSLGSWGQSDVLESWTLEAFTASYAMHGSIAAYQPGLFQSQAFFLATPTH